MKVKPENITAAKPKIGGAVHRAPVGTTLPTDAVTELDAAFKSMGYISEEGVTNTNFAAKETVRDWSGATVAELSKEKPDRFKMTFLEALSASVLKVVYGEDNVTGDLDTGMTIKANEDDDIDYAWVIEMVQRGGVLKRIVIPRASVAEVGEIVYAANKPVSYQITLSAKAGEDGQTHYEYLKKRGVQQ